MSAYAQVDDLMQIDSLNLNKILGLLEKAESFYKTELENLNTEIDPKKKNILVIGDSFSAHPASYVKQLTENFIQYNFINASVPGTGIMQHELFIRE